MSRAVLWVLVLASCGGGADAHHVPASPDSGLVSDGSVDGHPDAHSFCPTLGTACEMQNLTVCTVVGQPPDYSFCQSGCVSEAPAHCATVTPSSNVMTGADLHPDPSLLDIHITNLATINTDTGEITGIRSAGFGVIAGISFDVRGTAGVFRLHSLVVDEDVAIVGANAFALASLDDVHINKFVTARGDCTTTHGGPGGFAGGALGMPGSGPGGGAAGFAVGAFATGAGGGANGAHAGDGGVSSQTTSVMGGPAYGDPQISILRGGSGGGGGAGVGGVGGGGGGAVQIVSNTLISFNPPTMYQGMIDVSGCPGRAGSDGSGGGGGGGGTILLEARDVFMFSDALLLTTGAGGGGSGPGATDGGSDYLSRGGFNGSNGADGGDGGTHNFDALTLEGSPGTNGGSWGGGGGGGVGRIRVNSLHTPTLSGVYVPPFTDATTTATIGVPSVE